MTRSPRPWESHGQSSNDDRRKQPLREDYDGNRSRNFCNQFVSKASQHRLVKSKKLRNVKKGRNKPTLKDDGLAAFDFVYGWKGRPDGLYVRIKRRFGKLVVKIEGTLK